MTRPESVGFLDRSVPGGTRVCAFVSGPDALRTHPMVVVDAMTHDNPYYIDPGELLRRIGTR